MKTLSRLVLGSALCLLLTSCLTLSENPLSSPDTAQPDPALVGVWHPKDDTDETLEFTIKDAHWMHLEDRKKNRSTESYDLFTTMIDGKRFLNVQHLDIDDHGKSTRRGYFIVRYEVTGRTFTTWWMDQDKVAEAVRSGKLKGIIRQDKNPMMVGNPPHPDVDVTLHDSGTNLVKFIRKAGPEALFNDKAGEMFRVENTPR